MNIQEETFFYREMTEKIAEVIESSLSEGAIYQEGIILWDYPISILNDELAIDWTFEVVKDETLRKNDYVLSASAGANESDMPSIHIFITLPKGSWVKKHNVCPAALRGVIAHEIHHLAQNSEESNFFSESHSLIKKIDNARVSYLLCSLEIEAFKIGARAESFYSGKPQREIMLEYLMTFDMCKDDASQIADVWMSTSFPAFKENLRRSNAND